MQMYIKMLVFICWFSLFAFSLFYLLPRYIFVGLVDTYIWSHHHLFVLYCCCYKMRLFHTKSPPANKNVVEQINECVCLLQHTLSIYAFSFIHTCVCIAEHVYYFMHIVVCLCFSLSRFFMYFPSVCLFVMLKISHMGVLLKFSCRF